jgi:DNA-binding LytR/AlgR family response regulator
MRIAICDDEKEICKLLGSKVKKLYPEAEIVFYVTGEEEYVFQAFDVGAFHYIVKPFCDESIC